MPIALLSRIAREVLPCILTHHKDLEAAAVLVQAGHVEGWMQLVCSPSGGLPYPGIVISEITPSGRAMLSLDSLKSDHHGSRSEHQRDR